jgi:hypothetical protein
MWTQFPDLTEFPSIYSIEREKIGACKTEFAFVLIAHASKNTLADVRVLGFNPVSCMNNWWPTHRGETRLLTLCWGRVPGGALADLDKVKRKHWGYCGGYQKDPTIEPLLAGSGCGLKIGEIPLTKKSYNRFFTLMRLPVEITPLQERWLKKYHYRFLDKGSIASYWVNGWPVEEWTAEKEYAYFKTTKAEWAMEGVPPEKEPVVFLPPVVVKPMHLQPAVQPEIQAIQYYYDFK